MSQSVLRALSKDTLVYGLGDALGRLIGLLLLPVLSRIFGPADYGKLTVLEVSYLFLVVSMQLGANAGFQRFYYRREGLERRELTTSVVVFAFLLNIVCATGMWFLRGHLSGLFAGQEVGVAMSIGILAWTLPIEANGNHTQLILRLNQRPRAFSVLTILRVILIPTLTLLFVAHFDSGVPGVFGARAISLAVVALVGLWLCRDEFMRKPRWSIYAEAVRFGAPGHPGTILKTLMRLLPQYAVAYFAPLAAVGLFGVANRVSSALRVATQAFHRAWNPIALQLEGDSREVSAYDRVVRLVTLGLIAGAGLLSLFGEALLAALTPPEFLGSAMLIPWLSVSIAADGVALSTSSLLYTRDLVRWTSYLAIARLGVFILVVLFLAPGHAAWGVAVAAAASSVASCGAYLGLTVRLLGRGVAYGRTSVALAVGVFLACAVGIEEPVLNSDLAVRSIVALATLCLLSGLLVHKSEWVAGYDALCRRVSRSNA